MQLNNLEKMKKGLLFSVLTIVLVFGLCALYYYYPRKVSFELAEVIEKPYPDFDRTSYVGFEYVEDAEGLKRCMIDKYSHRDLKGYSLIFVEDLAKRLDFTKYDYLITYQKELKALRHSPYLSRTQDGMPSVKQIPLIPTWDSARTDKIYIYRIKKNNKYRPFGP